MFHSKQKDQHSPSGILLVVSSQGQESRRQSLLLWRDNSLGEQFRNPRLGLVAWDMRAPCYLLSVMRFLLWSWFLFPFSSIWWSLQARSDCPDWLCRLVVVTWIPRNWWVEQICWPFGVVHWFNSGPWMTPWKNSLQPEYPHGGWWPNLQQCSTSSSDVRWRATLSAQLKWVFWRCLGSVTSNPSLEIGSWWP